MKTNQKRNALVVCSVILFGLISFTPQAQNGIKKPISEPKFHLQPNAGLIQYFGDLNQKKYWNQHTGFTFGTVLSYQLYPIFGLRTQLLKTNIYSERADQNIVLNSNLWDAALNLSININKLIQKLNGKSADPYYTNKFPDLYLFTGAGISSFKSKLTDMETGELLKEHSSWQKEFSLPFGAGAAFRLNNALTINLEYGDHSIFGGEKLDFTDNSKQNNDHYSYASVGLQISIGTKDTDNDGVTDKNDLCPVLYGKVALAGCPDNDNDGVADKDDACPDVAGAIEFSGCPDKDGDKIIDREDNCPNVAGKRELNGCPDKDNDGVADKFDNCPEVPGKKEFAGCPDLDGDGVPDNDDKCPDVSGRKELAGCPDYDGDGIIDSQDSCINNAGKKELAGCPDRDNDGIADKDDSCPDNKGFAIYAGCPDRDSDGIADKDDSCPDNKGFAIYAGCPDTDGDGIPDNKDNCPKEAGVISNNGCPKVRKVPEITLMKTIYFDPGNSVVLPTFRNTRILDEIFVYMKENPDAQVSVAGFEDATEAVNKGFHLFEKRADYVINHLMQKGISPSRIKKINLDKKKPAGDNTTAEGRALNRRVEIKVTK